MLIVIDRHVDDIQTLIDGVQVGAKVLVLDDESKFATVLRVFELYAAEIHVFVDDRAILNGALEAFEYMGCFHL